MLQTSAALILAAGNSSRMGINKAFLRTNCGKSFVSYLIDGFRDFGIKTVVLVVNREVFSVLCSDFPDLSEKCTFVVNASPQQGRFSSVKMGLHHLTDYSNIFLHNIDNPFLSENLLQLLLKNKGQNDVCIPTYKNKGGHPILISAKVAKAIDKEKLSDINLKSFIETFETVFVEQNEPGICLNINSPEDYIAYQINSFNI